MNNWMSFLRKRIANGVFRGLSSDSCFFLFAYCMAVKVGYHIFFYDFKGFLLPFVFVEWLLLVLFRSSICVAKSGIIFSLKVASPRNDSS